MLVFVCITLYRHEAQKLLKLSFLNIFYFRDLETVLKEDKQKLKQMQKLQPKFTEEQKKELIEVHPWIQQGGLPKTVANSVSLNELVTFACITMLKLLAACYFPIAVPRKAWPVTHRKMLIQTSMQWFPA